MWVLNTPKSRRLAGRGKRREQLHVGNGEHAIGSIRAVGRLVNMFFCISDAILFKKLHHIWRNWGEVNDLIAINPRTDSCSGICRFGFKGNKSHNSSFLGDCAFLFK